MIRWAADDELARLIQRYYAGEAGLWEEIRQRVDADLRRKEAPRSAYHFRFRATGAGYDILVEDARDYVIED